MRCDNNVGGRLPGCVFSNIPGVFAISGSANPKFAGHVSQAIGSGLPGRLTGATGYLTYLPNDGRRTSNGNLACPASLPRPVGLTCNEFPFRYTFEGAFTAPVRGVARSFTGCRMPDPQRTGGTGWSRCFIPAGENSAGGGLTGSFYGDERMQDQDPFVVGFRP